MSNDSLNRHEKGANRVPEWVWYDGTDELQEGEAVCYNADYGTAASIDGRRANRVERPSRTNSKAFAGVAHATYPAQANTGGRMIEINCPGSMGVNVALAVNTMIGTGMLSFQAGGGSGAGRFYTGKYKGRGSVIPRQTAAAVIVEASMDGTWSLATDGITLTVASTTGLAAGDRVVLVAGEMEIPTKYLVTGKYTISSITSTTVLVLTESAVSLTPVGALTCTGYAYSGNAKCQADLLTGDESGGVEFLSVLNAGSAALAHMVGGVSYITATDISGDADIVLAQGTLPGETKAVVCLGTIGTSDYTVDPATDGVQMDGSSTLAVVSGIDAAADAWYGQFGGGLWHTADVVGGATEA